ALAGGLVAADRPAPPTSPTPAAPAADDVQDFLFLAGDRPWLFRLHITNDGKSYQATWEAFVRDCFVFFDRNNDGVLSKDEAAKIPTIQTLREQFFSGAIGFFGGGQSNVPFAELDRNGDGKVTVDEFLDYFRRNGFTALQLRSAGIGGLSGALTDVL